MNEKPTFREMDESAHTIAGSVRDGAAAVKDAARKAADTLGDVASSAQESATQSAVWQSGMSLADDASDRVAEAADYVRTTDAEEIWNDVIEFVKSRPGPSLAAAAVIGFLVGRSLRRT